MSIPPLAVTGATGAVGGRVARRLADAAASQTLLVRDPSRAPELPNAAVARGSFAEPAALRAGFAGAHTLFLVSAAEDADRVALHTAAVDAAVAAGVQRIVYLSFLGAAPDATFTFARDHYATEQHIRSTGLAFTFLRDSFYADLLPHFVDAEGVIRGPAGTGRVSAVTRDDIAAVAASVLLDDTGATDGNTYDVTGPEAISLAEVAAELSTVTGRSISYYAETTDEAYASRSSYGAPEFEVTGWVTSYVAIATGELSAVSDSVPRLTGRPATSFAQMLRDDPGSWAHLVGSETPLG